MSPASTARSRAPSGRRPLPEQGEQSARDPRPNGRPRVAGSAGRSVRPRLAAPKAAARGCTVTSASAPPPRVRAAFGVTGPAVRLAGGQGLSWRVGEVVLKPHVEPGFQEWLGTEVAAIEQHGFRLPAVRRALDSAWVVEGWAAQAAVPGSTQRGSVADWRSIIEASRALHAAAEALVRPAFLDLRTDPWARAD